MMKVKATRSIYGISAAAAVSLLAMGSVVHSTAAYAATKPAKTSSVLPEIEVSPDEIIDNEYDWGRYGCHCPTCNYGDGNDRQTFTDRAGNLWLAHVDPNTGMFIPQNAQGQLIDTNAAFTTDFGNGSEWMNSVNPSQIIYTKYIPGKPHNAANAGSAVATPNGDGTWTAGVIPGGWQTHSPLASLNLEDVDPINNFQNGADTEVLWQLWGQNTSTVVPDSSQSGGGSRRWVTDAHTIVFTTGAPPDSTGTVYQQVFTFNVDTTQLEQLTTDPVTKWGAFMWRAPEYNGDYVFLTVSGRTNLAIYHQITDAMGNSSWQLSDMIAMPTSMPYIWSPEPFIFNGKSYVMFQISSSSQANDFSVPTQIAFTGINPAVPSFRMLTNDASTPRVRMDPEYYITTNGPIVYYNRYHLATATQKQSPDGVWYAPTNLGAPIGNPCENNLPIIGGPGGLVIKQNGMMHR